MRTFYTYIMASKTYGTLYVGVTNGLVHRAREHRMGNGSSFTRKYAVHHLVWFQMFSSIDEAIQREKTIKEWPRQWKINLIERENPNWQDLFATLPGAEFTTKSDQAEK